MRKIFLIPILLLTASGEAQIKYLNDPAIVAQHRRQVYEGWGDFRPYPKYVLGIQTNFAYATVWGWLSPQKNQEYKNGPDIRPIGPTGLEVKRLVALEFMRADAEKIKKDIDSLHTRNVADFAHYTSATVDADPLWLLYYKTMLNPLKNFPAQPQNYLAWGLDNPKQYEILLENGGIAKLQEWLDLLKDQYKNSRTHNMPRGKRFLMYHDTLIGWRAFSKKLRRTKLKTTAYQDLLAKLKNKSISNQPITRTDKEIAVQVMQDYKNKF